MKISTLLAGTFKLDGGAMFGIIPKSMWQKQHPADEKNLCTWTCRLLLLETEDRKILVDTGMGNIIPPNFLKHFEDETPELTSVVPYPAEAITDVFITHLHFDHVGGALKIENGEIVPRFPNATYWSNEPHWNFALQPNAKEKASFIRNTFEPLEKSGQLQFIHLLNDPYTPVDWLPNIKIWRAFGHTHDMMGLEIQHNGKIIMYPTDLLPAASHVSMPWVMSYDIQPLVTLQEKERLLNYAYDNQALLILEHDIYHEAITLTKNDRGRITVANSLTIEAFLQI